MTARPIPSRAGSGRIALALAAPLALAAAAAGCGPTILSVRDVAVVIPPAMPRQRLGTPLVIVAGPDDVHDEEVIAIPGREGEDCGRVRDLRTFVERDVTSAFRAYFDDVRFADAAQVPAGALTGRMKITRVFCLEGHHGTEVGFDVRFDLGAHGRDEPLWTAQGTTGSAPRDDLRVGMKQALESVLEEIVREFLKADVVGRLGG